VIRFECDRCGESLEANDAGRFIVKLEVYAAAGPVELDLAATGNSASELTELLQQLREADADEVEDQTYRSFRFDLCDACRRILIADPLPRRKKTKR